MFFERPEIGKSGWAVDSLRHPLPTGLAGRSPVVVTGMEGPGIQVRDTRDREWTLCRQQVDVGQGYWLDGEYHAETDPKAVLHLRHTLLALEQRMRRETEELHGSPSWWQDDRDRVRWYLSRNGNDPDEPLPPGSQAPRLTGPP
ncbi:MAG: hypothetical protein EOP88_20445 [Verrucomicrobiaceae bacterium]|nr:MAG: hypothetical protein EOP88_20445 [Verrucomicrobiaceae bacterium]